MKISERFRDILIMGLVIVGFSCDPEKNPIQPLQEQTMPISYAIGQKWLYKRAFVNVGLSQIMDYPDTIPGYAFFEVTGTETINDTQYFIIEGIDYDIGKVTVDSFPQKWAVLISDSVLKVLEYDTDGFGFSQGPFKQRASSGRLPFPAKLRQSLYKKAHIEYLPGFRDEVYPLRFPLVKDQKWIYRYGIQSQDTKDMYREYLGQETVSVPAGNIRAYKIDWLLPKYWAGQLEDAANMAGFDWYNSKGLVRRFFQYGESDVTDSVGIVIGTITRSYDILEFLGEFGIDSDTLRPYGQ